MNDEYKEDIVLAAIRESKYTYFTLATLLCVFQGTDNETDIQDFLSYLIANGYTTIVGQNFHVLTKRGKDSGYFIRRSGDHRIYLTGHGFLHFLGEILDGKVWKHEE